MRPHSFTAAHRLHSGLEFDRLYKQGRRHSDKYFTVLSRSNERSCARLGLSISAKSVGNAVARNRVKRIIRESFRLRLHELPAIDIVVNARPAVRDAANATLQRSLHSLWTHVIEQCAPSSLR